MSFVFTLDLDHPGGIPTRIIRHQGEKVAIAHVGVDHHYPLTYSIIVGISPGAGCDEFYFKLIEVDAKTGEEREFWKEQEIGDGIKENDRDLIFQVIRRVTKLLIATERPHSFYFCTHGDNLPPQELENYESINQVFTDCGYQVSLTNSDRGRYSWWVERC